MRILFLTQIIPWPIDAGPKVKTWNVLRYLHDQGHEIVLVSFVRQEEKPYVHMMNEVCEKVYSVPIRRSLLANGMYYVRSLFSKRPFLIERDNLSIMRTTVKEILRSEQIDVIHADQLSMVQFAFDSAYPDQSELAKAGDKKPVFVFDAHNAVWTIVDRMRKNASWIMKPILSLELHRIKKYEGAVVRYFDHTFAVAEPDAAALRQAAEFRSDAKNNGKISVVPIAVDAEALKPVKQVSDSCKILTLGTLHYPPNADGIRWFAGEVFPLIKERIPGVTLTIVGKNPPRDIQQFETIYPDAVRVTGYVPDLDPYFEEAAVVVVPVRAGGGMRVRILEAFARGMPMVTTTVGLEGIDAEPGREVLVEDSPMQFAGAVIRLLQDENLRQEIAMNGRKLIERKYDYRVVLDALQIVYQRRVNNFQSTETTAAVTIQSL